MTNLERLLDPATVEAELVELEALEKAATLGPWVNGPDEIQSFDGKGEMYALFKVLSPPSGLFDEHCANGDLVTSLRNAAPKLFAAIRELHKRNAAAIAERDEARDQVGALVAKLKSALRWVPKERADTVWDDDSGKPMQEWYANYEYEDLETFLANLSPAAAARHATIEAPLRQEILRLRQALIVLRAFNGPAGEFGKVAPELARRWEQADSDVDWKVIVEFIEAALTPDDGWLAKQLAAAERKGAREARKERQTALLAWAVDNFGLVAKDRVERAMRLIEEAVEVVQVQGLPKERIYSIVDRSYSRPVGELNNEIGGLAMTLEALAESEGIDVEEQSQIEFDRITSIPKEWWQKKHAEKVAAGTAVEAEAASRERQR